MFDRTAKTVKMLVTTQYHGRLKIYDLASIDGPRSWDSREYTSSILAVTTPNAMESWMWPPQVLTLGWCCKDNPIVTFPLGQNYCDMISCMGNYRCTCKSYWTHWQGKVVVSFVVVWCTQCSWSVQFSVHYHRGYVTTVFMFWRSHWKQTLSSTIAHN